MNKKRREQIEKLIKDLLERGVLTPSSYVAEARNTFAKGQPVEELVGDYNYVLGNLFGRSVLSFEDVQKALGQAPVKKGAK